MKSGPAILPYTLHAVLLACMLQACASASETREEPAGNAEPAQQSEETVQADGAPPAAAPTDAEVMYNVFAGELLGNDGNLAAAVSSYLQAAMESDDPAIAQRATRVALAAQSWFEAAMAADRWALLAPNDMAAREAAAATMLATQDYSGAELQLGEILKRNDDSDEAWSMVTTLLAQASDPRKARDLLERLIADNGETVNADVVFVQSQLLARMGEFEESAKYANQALEMTPERVELLTFSGRLALSMEDLDTAVERFGKAWELAPDNHDLGLAYADLLARQARPDDARKVMQSMDQTPDVLLSRVLFEITAEQTENARQVYAEFETLPTEDRNEKLYYQGQAAEAIGEPAEAIGLYSAISEGPYFVPAAVRRAELMANEGDIDGALESLAAVRQRGNPQESEQAWLAEGRLLRESGQVQAAFDALGRALEDFGNSVPIRYSHALLASELGNIEVAEYDLRLVLEQQPDNPAALNALGYTLADQTDRYSEAEALVQRAYELQPDDASIIDSMGWVAFRLNKLDEAEAYLRRAWEMDNNPEIAAHLGEVLWAKGEYAEARAVWADALEIDGEHAVLLQTMQRLDEQP